MPDENAGDVLRIARDYAMMRLELIAQSDLQGYTEEDLKDLGTDFLTAQMKLLVSLPSQQRQAEMNASATFERLMKQVMGQLRALLKEHHDVKDVKPESSSICAKLPKIQIRSFDGQVENWVSFIQLFNSLIHDREIPNVEKLHYLLSSVQGTAYNLIKNFPLTNDSYLDAYNVLVKHYDKTCHIAMSYYDKLVNCEPIKTKSGTELERVYRTFSENLSVLNRYKLPDKNFMLFHLLWSKLDKSTREAFQLEHNSNDIPIFENLQAFMEKHFKALELVNSKPSSGSNSSFPKNTGCGASGSKPKTKTVLVAQSVNCPCCSSQHALSNCNKFLKLDVESRFKLVKENGLCILCFSNSHRVKSCRSTSRCGQCNYSHNTLLHFNKQTPPQSEEPPKAILDSNTVLTSLTKPNNVLFSTAKVLVKDKVGHFKPIRVLLDSASACNFISASCAKALGLQVNNCKQSINGIGHSVTEPLGTLSCELKSFGSLKSFVVEALVLPAICAEQPTSPVDPSWWSHISGLPLADPDFARPGPVDMLLNAEVLSSVLLPGMRRGQPGQPIALNTIFGWILLGGCDATDNCNSRFRSVKADCFLVSNLTNLSLDDSIKRFWEIENVSPSNVSMSKEDQLCESYFVKSHTRTNEGRFVVPLPFVDPLNKPIFSESRDIALKRLLSLEKKFASNPEFRNAYSSFMDEYAACRHLEEVDPPASKTGRFYYIPHHGILRPESVSTPLRVVFDASCKDSRGVSLNDTLLAGPKLQTNIFDLLLRFRWHSVVFTGDVKQMYRQILVPEEDADYQRILWRPDPVGPVRDYRLNTVTYGVSSAPYQALRTIAQLAETSKIDFPSGSSVLSRDIYVDDVVTGGDSIESALSLRSELSRILASGGFHLRKWTSNHKDFFVDLPATDLYSEHFRQFEDAKDVSLKILGLSWSPGDDTFQFKVSVDNRRHSKRTILSDIARIYDPLGFLGPVTFYAKYIMQLLWTSGVSWDEDVPEGLASEWSRFKSQLPLLASLSIPRRMTKDQSSVQLHGFCDASERGYCASLYIRVESEDGVSVELCCSKTKVAPLRKLSIPRLELQAAVLLADLVESVTQALMPIYLLDKVILWSDSTVALAWIKSCPSKWKTFVANRVAHIQEKVPPDCWRHVGTSDNPADCGSRGMLPSELVGRELWWNGPSWLIWSPELWPVSVSPRLEEEAQIEQKIFALVTSPDGSLIEQLVNKFSSLNKLTRVLSYCFRFLHNLKQRSVASRNTGALQPAELGPALLFLVKHVQQNAFSHEIASLKKGSRNSLPKGLRKLSPFIDDLGFLRVGGRLAHSRLSYDQKYPLLLPRNSHLTTLVIEDYHKRFLHPGPQTLQNLVRRNFWILSAKRAINSIISKCVQCFRAHPKPAPAPLMGDLPSCRVNQVKPFSKVAIDYGGPFDIALGRGRGVRTFKSYICVFVCTSTKAIHIELASELSTEAFLAALKRFIARRGRCTEILSDQGRNFIGASNHLDNLLKNASEEQQIKFSFNPPGSPHFNGLAEAGIKSVKTHLTRVVGKQRLTFEEFYTVLTQIEAMLNSRPLTPMSADPNDFVALTPGHFLTQEPLSILPEENYVDCKLSVSQRWKLIQKMHQDFWRRWRSEYIHTLQQRTKWNKSYDQIKIGTLVLIVNEQCTPLKWSLGRIVTLHTGPDGVCRVVTVKTPSGQYKRPLVKLCPLPLQ